MKASKSAIAALETVIKRLERWQIRNADKHDPAALAMHAKNELMRLLSRLEESREREHAQ